MPRINKKRIRSTPTDSKKLKGVSCEEYWNEWTRIYKATKSTSGKRSAEKILFYIEQSDGAPVTVRGLGKNVGELTLPQEQWDLLFKQLFPKLFCSIDELLQIIHDYKYWIDVQLPRTLVRPGPRRTDVRESELYRTHNSTLLKMIANGLGGREAPAKMLL